MTKCAVPMYNTHIVQLKFNIPSALGLPAEAENTSTTSIFQAARLHSYLRPGLL